MKNSTPILILGTSSKCVSEFKKIRPNLGKLSKVTVFFQNTNFLITEYNLLNDGVHMVLEFHDGNEVQLEGTNCGYGGGGPNATLDVLEECGLSSELTRPLIFYNDSVRFYVDEDTNILNYTINISDIFYPSIRETGEIKDLNRINKDEQYDVDLTNRKVMVYNPQIDSFKGFINITSYMDIYEMEYFLGDNSPLEGYYRFKQRGFYQTNSDVFRGIKHVNLILRGNNFDIICLINRSIELEVINAIHLLLTGKPLEWIKRYTIQEYSQNKFSGAIRFLIDLFRNRETDIHERIDIVERKAERKGNPFSRKSMRYNRRG